MAVLVCCLNVHLISTGDYKQWTRKMSEMKLGKLAYARVCIWMGSIVWHGGRVSVRLIYTTSKL